MRVAMMRFADLWKNPQIQTGGSSELLLNANSVSFEKYLEGDSNLERLGIQKGQGTAQQDEYRWIGWEDIDLKTGRSTILKQGYAKISSTSIRVDVAAMEAVLNGAKISAQNTQISVKKEYDDSLKNLLAQIGVNI